MPQNDPYAGVGVPIEPAQKDPYAGIGVTVDDQPDAPKQSGWEALPKALEKGATDTIGGVANTVDKFAPDGAPGGFWDGVHQLAKRAQVANSTFAKSIGTDPESYGTTHGQSIRWNDPSTWVKHGPLALAEGGAGLGISVAAPELKGLGFIGSEVLQHAGNNLDARMANQPAGAKPTDEDRTIAGLSTGAQAALGKVGLGKLNPFPGKVIPSVAGAIGINAGLGGVGNIIDQQGRGALTAANPGLAKPDLDEAGNAATFGGLTGAALRGAQIPGDVISYGRQLKFGGSNAAASADLANTLVSTGHDVGTPKGAFGAHEVTSDIISDRLKAAQGDPNGAKPVLDADPGLTARVQETLTKIKAGQVIPEKQLTSLQSDLGDQGAALSHNIRVANAQTMLKGMGNFDKSDHTFAGGLSATPAGKLVNPLGAIKGLLSHAGAGGVGALGVLALENHGLLAMLPKLIAGGATATAALRGIDAITGMRNPTASFVNNLRQKGFTAPTPPPAQDQGTPHNFPPAPTAAQLASVVTMQAREAAKAAKANDQNVPAPTVSQLKWLAGVQQGEALKAAKAASKAAAQGSLARTSSYGGSMGPYDGPEIASTMPQAPSSGPPGYIPPLPPRVEKILEKLQIGGVARPSDNMPGPGASGPPTFSASGFMSFQKPVATVEPRTAKSSPTLQSTPETSKATPASPSNTGKGTPADNAPTGEIIRVERRGQVVERPADGVKDIPAYISEIEHHLDARADMAVDLHHALPDGAKFDGGKHIDAFLRRLNDRHMTETKADIQLERFAKTVPASKREAVEKIIANHRSRVLGTFDQ